VIVEIGAGTPIPSVRHFGQRLIQACGARMIRINPRTPQVASSDDVGLAAGLLEALQVINTLVLSHF